MGVFSWKFYLEILFLKNIFKFLFTVSRRWTCNASLSINFETW